MGIALCMQGRRLKYVNALVADEVLVFAVCGDMRARVRLKPGTPDGHVIDIKDACFDRFRLMKYPGYALLLETVSNVQTASAHDRTAGLYPRAAARARAGAGQALKFRTPPPRFVPYALNVCAGRGQRATVCEALNTVGAAGPMAAPAASQGEERNAQRYQRACRLYTAGQRW